MLKILSFLLFLLNLSVMAQDLSGHIDFIEKQNTLGSPYNIPVYIDLEGNINILSHHSNASVSIGPLAHTIWTRNKSHYIKAKPSSHFAFLEQEGDLGWIEVKRNRWELGLGLEATVASNVIAVGLTPFKGAREIMIRQTKTMDDKTSGPSLPRKLKEISDWQVGDSGTFQRYGGVSVYAGLSFSVVNILTAGIVIQNLFSINIRKLSSNKVQLMIAEENLKNRRLQAGVTLATTQIHFLSGHKVASFFTLDLENPDHHKLYRDAVKGKLHLLQEKLPQEAQRMDWKGTEKKAYFGIPGVAGRNFQRSHYDFETEDDQDAMDVKSRKNAGILLPLRNHSRIVYQSDNDVTLFWFSEMNKARIKELKKRFLTPGKIIGAEGFDDLAPEKRKLGSTVTQIGLSFNRSEFEAITPEILENVLDNFKQRCVEFNLDCKRKSKIKEIGQKLKEWMSGSWKDVRASLAFLMMDEPALIHAYVKTLNIKKRIYFKFLNQKYQSLEGTAAINY